MRNFIFWIFGFDLTIFDQWHNHYGRHIIYYIDWLIDRSINMDNNNRLNNNDWKPWPPCFLFLSCFLIWIWIQWKKTKTTKSDQWYWGGNRLHLFWLNRGKKSGQHSILFPIVKKRNVECCCCWQIDHFIIEFLHRFLLLSSWVLLI